MTQAVTLSDRRDREAMFRLWQERGDRVVRARACHASRLSFGVKGRGVTGHQP